MFSRSASRITRSRLRRYWGSWGGKQDQAGHGPTAELLDEGRVAEVGPDLPVGGDRAQVDDPDVTDRGQRLFALFGDGVRR